MFVLESAIYRRSGDWGKLFQSGKSAVSRALGRVIGIQIDEALGEFPVEDVGMNMVVTTMLDMPFTSGWITWDDLSSAIDPWTKSRPQNIVSAYECSSWGFVLRYAKSCQLGGPLVVITIVDVNVLNLSHWHANVNWGVSGFGISTLVFRCSEDDVIQCHVAKGTNGFGEFCIDLRNYMMKDRAVLVTPPFFPPNISALYDRLLPQDRLLRNRVDEYGHSFGSDPWIALIEQRRAGLDGPHDRYLAASVSLNGYWCLAELKLGHAGRFLIPETLAGPGAVLE